MLKPRTQRVTKADISCTIAAMKVFREKGMRGLAVLLVLAMAACARTPPPGADAAPAFSKLAAVEVFEVGYANIQAKYIDEVSIGDLALDGMKGLEAIDPSLGVTRSGGAVTLSSNDRPIARFPAPGNDDAQAWAAMTVEVSAAGRDVSDDLRKAEAERIYESVFDGVLSNLDVFSRYAGAREARRNRAKRDGFGGIGIRFRVKGGLVRITQVMPKTPAARSGLKKDDVITHVGSVSLEGLETGRIGEMLRGPVRSKVRVTVARTGAPLPLSFVIKRTHIIPPTVTKTVKNGIVFLKISSFNQGTARNLAEKLKQARRELGRNMLGVVLDLRGNPGGLLRQSIKVADLFLTRGRLIKTRGRHPDSIQFYEAGGRDMAFGHPLAVLLDGGSASAAEVVAAALQDRGRAVVIGTSSFGKGTVQTVVRLPNDGEMTLTWSRLITPTGYTLHGIGVLPVICTSGRDGDPLELISAALKHRLQTEATMESWRTAGLEQKERRRQLRATCPAERRKKAVEGDVASRLLSDSSLYARVLDFSAPATAARE